MGKTVLNTKRELLWTNSSSSGNSSFSVNIDVRNYPFLIIDCVYVITDGTNNHSTGNVIDTKYSKHALLASQAQGNSAGRRGVTISSSTGYLSFTNGWLTSSNANSSIACVPIRIWGIK